VGVLSEADVLRDGLLPDPTRHEIRTPVAGRTVALRVKDVMTTMPVSVTADGDLAEAAQLLVDTQVKSLPVVEHDHLVGIVRRSAVIAMLARRDPLIEAEVDELLRAAVVDFLVEVVDGVVRLDGPSDEHIREIARVLASTVAGGVGAACVSGPGGSRRGRSTGWSECAVDRQRAHQVPALPQPPAGELGPAEPPVQAAAFGRPGRGLPGASYGVELVGVDDRLRAAAGYHAPAPLVLVVELVHLEGEHRALRMAAEQAVRRGPQHDRVIGHGVVDRDDVRPVGRA